MEKNLYCVTSQYGIRHNIDGAFRNDKDRKFLKNLTPGADGEYLQKYILNGYELDPGQELENILNFIRVYARNGDCARAEAGRLAAGVMSLRYEDLPYLKIALRTLQDPLGTALAAGLDCWSPKVNKSTADFVARLQKHLGLGTKREMISLEGDWKKAVPTCRLIPEREILCEIRRDLYFVDSGFRASKSLQADLWMKCGVFHIRRDAKNGKRFRIDSHRRDEGEWTVSGVNGEMSRNIFDTYRRIAAKRGQVVTVNSMAFGKYRKYLPHIPIFVEEIVKPLKIEDYNAVKRFIELGDYLEVL
ncbi:MAG: hypothetical protein NT118_15950 [Lentisphaerae bacterium]|nr:hypothetical protein [Lentisphaerota bacterium]